LEDVYTNDEIAWCGLWMAIVTKRAGWEPVDNPLWARNWAKFGEAVDKPMLGDVLVFSREAGGHVGMYVGESAKSFHVLGGNQSNAVSFALIDKGRLIAARRPIWRIAQPVEVASIIRNGAGIISTNEA